MAFFAALALLTPAQVWADPMFHISHDAAGQDHMTIIDESWDGMLRGIMPGSVVFSGTLDRNNMLSGTAYAFKLGCAPTPYAFDMKGTYYPNAADVELYGAVPIFADDSCKVADYNPSHLSLTLPHVIQMQATQ